MDQEAPPQSGIMKETDIDLLEGLVPENDPGFSDVIRLSGIHGFMKVEKLLAQLELLKMEEGGVVDQVATEAVNQNLIVLMKDGTEILERLGMSQEQLDKFIGVQKWSAVTNLRNQITKLIDKLKGGVSK